MLSEGGAGYPLSAAAGSPPAISGECAYYPTGAAADPSGGTWISCAQGLLYFDRNGRAGRRLGGFADPGLIAVGPDGTVLTLLEGNGRITRSLADDFSDAPLSCNANEPWRVGDGWTGRAVGIVFDGDGYLVLDRVAKRLWRFDPNHTGWHEQTWTPLTKDGAFQNPRAIAVDDDTAYVLDGNVIRFVDLSDPETAGGVLPLPADITASAVTALSAADGRLFVATPYIVFAIDLSGHELWRTATPFSGVTSLAARSDAVFVVDRSARRVIVLSTDDGRSAAALTSAEVRGSFEPVTAAVEGKWLFVTDAAGDRVVRFRYAPAG